MRKSTDRIDRAPWVCKNCKVRKRACDKRLPQCGFCTSRGYTCSYVNGPSKRKISVPQAQAGGSLTHVGGFFLDGDINDQVGNILKSVQLTSHTVIEHYFRDFHQHFPVIAPRAQLLTQYLNPTNTSAGVSVLILAMALISQHLPVADTLYSTLRQLFWTIQESSSLEISLVQIELLIAIFEYARGWMEKAFVSIGVAARLAQVLGIDKLERPDALSHGDNTSLLCKFEPWNVWCGIMLLESVILSEMPELALHENTGFPNENAPFPSDLTETFDVQKNSALTTPAVSAQVENVSHFGRQVQAVRLLNKAMKITWVISDSKKRLQQCKDLDLQLKDFLSILIQDKKQQKPVRDASVNIVVRALFILHENLLAEDRLVLSVDKVEQSRNTLSTMTAMLTDVAHGQKHERNFHHCIPFCCAENIKSARRWVAQRENGKLRDTDVDVLNYLEEAFCARWRGGFRL